MTFGGGSQQASMVEIEDTDVVVLKRSHVTTIEEMHEGSNEGDENSGATLTAEEKSLSDLATSKRRESIGGTNTVGSGSFATANEHSMLHSHRHISPKNFSRPAAPFVESLATSDR